MNVDDQTRTETGVREECGVFGIYDRTGEDVAPSIYYGLCALQHRGQESCGIAVSDTDGPQGNIAYHKDLGLVSEVFKAETMSKLHGNLGIGHVRYSTTGASVQENAQPLVLNYIKGTLALAHNGNLVNAEELKKELVYGGAVFHTTTDSEMIAYYIARERVHSKNVEEAVVRTARKLKGAYALVVTSPRKLIAVRDPFGLKPLCIGKRDNAYVVASESCALSSVGAEFLRDVEPGEILPVFHTTMTKEANAIAVGIGNKAPNTPAEVATPLPPRNLRYIVHICPHIATKPHIKGIYSDEGAKYFAISTASAPLKASHKNVLIPAHFPTVRYTFAAPGLPEP